MIVIDPFSDEFDWSIVPVTTGGNVGMRPMTKAEKLSRTFTRCGKI